MSFFSSSLYIPCCCLVLLFSPSLHFPFCCYVLFFFFIFLAAAMSYCTPLPLYSLLLLCPLVSSSISIPCSWYDFLSPPSLCFLCCCSVILFSHSLSIPCCCCSILMFSYLCTAFCYTLSFSLFTPCCFSFFLLPISLCVPCCFSFFLFFSLYYPCCSVKFPSSICTTAATRSS